jgi:hypothetical protein
VQEEGVTAELVRVFVSHHHSADEDRVTAQLVRDLHAVDADVWVDDQEVKEIDPSALANSTLR